MLLQVLVCKRVHYLSAGEEKPQTVPCDVCSALWDTAMLCGTQTQIQTEKKLLSQLNHVTPSVTSSRGRQRSSCKTNP